MILANHDHPVRRFVDGIRRVAAQYRLKSLQQRRRQALLQHDLQQHWSQHRLRELSLQVMDERGGVVADYAWNRDGQPANAATEAAERGEAPVAASRTTHHGRLRILVSRAAFERHGGQGLLTRWDSRPARELADPPGASARTGTVGTPPAPPAASAPATAPVAPAALAPTVSPAGTAPPRAARPPARSGSERVLLVITDTGTKGYAFGQSQDANGPGKVFLHINYAPAGFVFRRGERITARIVQTPAGIQARDISPA